MAVRVRSEARAPRGSAPDAMRAQQVSNFVAIVLPFGAFGFAVVMLWGGAIQWIDLTVLVVGYAVTCLGITVGFHRLLTHRSFQTYPAVRYSLAVLGTLAVEGSVIKWVADHRKHHDFADEDGDPHTPHEAEPGVLGGIKGLWHAHVGWLFNSVGQADRRRYAPDLLGDRTMRRIEAAEKPLIVVSLMIPFGVGLIVKGTLTGALLTLVWGGLVRIFFLHHATFSINSICHFFGRRRFETADQSRNVAWLSLATFGESWHNNHHAFPTSAFHGLRRRELDLGGCSSGCCSRWAWRGRWSGSALTASAATRRVATSRRRCPHREERLEMKILDALRSRRHRGSGADRRGHRELARQGGAAHLRLRRAQGGGDRRAAL